MINKAVYLSLSLSVVIDLTVVKVPMPGIVYVPKVGILASNRMTTTSSFFYVSGLCYIKCEIV